MPFHVWEQGAAPVSMTANACQIEWGLFKGMAATPPVSPVACVDNGKEFMVKLVPYANTRLRLGQVPVIKK